MTREEMEKLARAIHDATFEDEERNLIDRKLLLGKIAENDLFDGNDWSTFIDLCIDNPLA
jgi:hypothetical protein